MDFMEDANAAYKLYEESTFKNMAIGLSKRRQSIGSDGLIIIMPSDVADCKMLIFNADGSEGNMCGNGLRCVGFIMHHIRKLKKACIRVETKSGIKDVYVTGDIVTACIGKPDFDVYNTRILDGYVKVGHIYRQMSLVSMGNPHAVIFTKDLPVTYSDKRIEKISKQISQNKQFTNGINVEYAKIVDDGLRKAKVGERYSKKDNASCKIEMRVYERGSGETLACGTGACAVVAAALVTGRVGGFGWYTVIMPGGEAMVEIKPSLTMYLKSRVTYVLKGEVVWR